MADMISRYGEQKGKQVFYATANARGQNGPSERKPKPRQ